MGILGIFKALSPSRQLAAIVDGVIHRLKGKYVFSMQVVDGGFQFKIDDREPESTERTFCEPLKE